MPYILKNRAEELKGILSPDLLPANSGELNYLITQLLIRYIGSKGPSYHIISSAIGSARDAAEECRRRLLDAYEDKKIADSQSNIDPYNIFKHYHGLK